MDSLVKWMNMFRFVNDENRLYSDCLRTLQELMDDSLESKDKAEMFCQCVEFASALVSQDERTMRVDDQDAARDERLQNLESFKGRMFKMCFDFVRSDAPALVVLREGDPSCAARVTNLLNRILLNCCVHGATNSHSEYFGHLLEMFAVSSEDVPVTQIFNSIDLLVEFLDHDKTEVTASNQSNLVQKLKQAFHSWPEHLVSELFLKVIQTLWRRSPDRDSLKRSLLACCLSRSAAENFDSACSKAIFLICGLVDASLEDANVLDLHRQAESAWFWKCLGRGLTSPDVLTRKRSVCLLGKILKAARSSRVTNGNRTQSFEEESIYWENFLLILETLEETQFHVIQPVLERVEVIIRMSCNAEAFPLEPNSDWLMVIFWRMLDHDCIMVRRQAITLFLSSVCISGNYRGAMEFFCTRLLSSLQDSSLYYRSTGDERGSRDAEDDPSKWNVAEALDKFFKNLDLKEMQFGSFISFLLAEMASRSWNGPILCNLLRSMDHISCWHFLTLSEVLPDLRVLFTKTVAAFDMRVKATTRHCLAILVAHFVDPKTVVPSDLVSLATVLPRGIEFYQWREFLDWVKRCAEEEGFRKDFKETYELLLDRLLKSPCLPLDDCYSLDEFASEPHCSSIVKAILLVQKALELELTFQDSIAFEKRLVSIALDPLDDVLRQLIGHAYLPESKAYWVLVVLLTFMVNLKDDVRQRKTSTHVEDVKLISSAISRMLSESTESVLIFASRKFIQKNQTYSVTRLCSEAIRACSLFPEGRNATNLFGISGFERMFQWSIENLRELMVVDEIKISAVHLACLEMLSVAVESFPASLPPAMDSRYVQPLLRFLGSEFRFEIHQLEDFDPAFLDPSKLHVARDRMLECQLTLAAWLLRSMPPSTSVSLNLVKFVEDCMECSSVENCSKCCEVLRMLLEKDSEGVYILVSVWEKILELSKKRRFLDCYRSFVASVFQLELIDDSDRLNENHLTYVGALAKIANDVLEMSGERPQLLTILVGIICWQLKDRNKNMERILVLVPFLAKVLTFGPLQDRASRFRDDLIRRHELECLLPDSNHLGEDQSARLPLLQFLTTLSPSIREQSVFGFALLDELMSNYTETLARNARCYGNSLLHRMKHRMLVAIFALEKFVQDAPHAKKGQHLKFLSEVPGLEKQPSVRFLASWMLVRLVGSVESAYFKCLLKAFTESDVEQMKKPVLMTSLFHVISHVIGRSLRSGAITVQSHAIQKYLNTLLTWSTTPQSSTRIASQAAILFLTGCLNADQLNPDRADRPSTSSSSSSSSVLTLFNMSEFLLKNRSTYRHSFQLLESIYYQMDPWEDVSLEAITCYVPLLTGLTSDECMDVRLFDGSVRGSIPVLLPQHRRFIWQGRLQSGNLWKDNVTSSNNAVNLSREPSATSLNTTTNDSNKKNINGTQRDRTSGDVQKKITPWKESLLSIGRSLEGRPSMASGGDGPGLILIASLVDKIPNLGGLCRTCEIFGITTMVVNSSKVINDINFEKLSVTAHKWVNIEEVLVRNLPAYLSGLAREGYTLVALEQTARSTPLNEYQFPKKCAVILGNEKSGIPVEIIQQVEVCIEIPQQGVIRSLNVHVSGALLMWEYHKQTSLVGK